MRVRFPAVVMWVLAFALVAGAAIAATSRDEVLQKMKALREHGAQSRFSAEFQSLAEVYAVGEECLTRHDTTAAEGYFRLALLKGEVLEQKLATRAPAVSDLNAPAAPPTQPPAGAEHTGPAAPPTPPPGAPTVEAEPRADSPAPAEPQPGVEEAPPEDDVAQEQPAPRVPDHCDLLVGGETLYTVQKGDTLRSIGARFGVSKRSLAKFNNHDPKQPLQEGQVIKVANRHIIPKKLRDGLVINIADRMLYYFKGGSLVAALPVAVGRPHPKVKAKSKDKAPKDDPFWETPVGSFTIVDKVKDPTWRVPPSIRKEMEKNGQEVLTMVAPGRKNPLGKYAIRTSLPGILIHSTNAPSSIYGFSSHGCIRVRPEKMEQLFKAVRVNCRGEIIYQPVKVAVTERGRVFLEVHQDVYGKLKDLDGDVLQAVRRQRITQQIDWRKVQQVVKEKSGVAEDISL